jgi:transcription factor IIIB subunit 2
MNKTAHMLIDFADALSINVYQIGSTFLDLLPLVTSKEDTLPLVDPSLYISRFASKLEFGEKTIDVVRDANRVVLRFNRDWITQGRRPAGICAASLFISARMHGFQRSIKEIVLITKICENVVRQRLKEFEKTPSGQLTVSDFQTIWLEQDSNPPAFGVKKRKNDADCFNRNVLENEQMEDEVQKLIDTHEAPADINLDDLEDKLSDLDNDPEVLGMIDTNKESIAFKEHVWMTSNHDWILKQMDKELRGESAYITTQSRSKVLIF